MEQRTPTPEEWERLGEVFHAIRELPPAERAARLDKACADNPRMRAELEELLRASQAGSPTLGTFPKVGAETPEGDLCGQSSGPYRLDARLGSGGMGTVYRATDVRLGRGVAIKILPSGSLLDDTLRHRLMHEARVLSSLNHPNIITIYELEHNDNTDYIVMELVEGPTLAELMRRGPLPFERALALATQCADALAAAHGEGVIHRDIKPQNIMVNEKGTLKVVDFGIAKLLESRGGWATPDSLQSRPNWRLGTPSYMSPEQLMGKPSDERTDVYALGAVVYEMVTGQQAHPRGPEDLLEARQIIPPLRLPEGRIEVPPPLWSVIERCLAPDPANRFRTMKELHAALRGLRQGSQASGAKIGTLTRRRVYWVLLGIAVGALLAVAAAFVLRQG